MGTCYTWQTNSNLELISQLTILIQQYYMCTSISNSKMKYSLALKNSRGIFDYSQRVHGFFLLQIHSNLLYHEEQKSESDATQGKGPSLLASRHQHFPLCSLFVTVSIFPIKLSRKHQLPFPTTTLPVLCINTIKSPALSRHLFFAMGACGFVPGLALLGWWEQAGSSLSMPWPWLCLSHESPCQMDNWPWSLLSFCRISRTKGTVHPSKLSCYSTCS